MLKTALDTKQALDQYIPDIITFCGISEPSHGFTYPPSIKYYITHIYYNSAPLFC